MNSLFTWTSAPVGPWPGVVLAHRCPARVATPRVFVCRAPPTSLHRRTVDQLRRTDAMDVYAELARQALERGHGESDQAFRAVSDCRVDDGAQETTKALAQFIVRDGFAIDGLRRVARKFPYLGCTRHGLFAHQVRKNAAKQIGLGGREQSPAAADIPLLIARNDVHRIDVIELVALVSGFDQRQFPAEMIDEY